MFLISALLIVFAVSSYFVVHSKISAERNAIAKEAELQKLGFALSNASKHLTSEVRKFAVTLDPIHLRNYWTEVNVAKTREKVISRLRELDTPSPEFDLLNTAKNNSDDLMNTEARSMKLILEVYEVPEDQMEPALKDYQLSEEDNQLSFSDKVNLARSILYDSEYEKNKNSILIPIQEFNGKMTQRINLETLNARNNTDLSMAILIAAIISLTIYLIYLAWFMLYRVSIPLKTYLMSTEEGQVGEEEEKEKALKFIKQMQTLIE
jgi:hypothetical protein